ncbi:MAG: hypothetical protein KME52_28220 [Desmonostoc geniculatum HA4340-LM1]|jgi:hypothetical protein|nr:hypothetical protein [Desmonostoc geniculatum HA4340-LM1]
MDALGFREIPCRETYINKSAQNLTIYMRCVLEASTELTLIGCCYGIICIATFLSIFSNPLFILLFISELVIYFSFEWYREKKASSYEVWRFEKNEFIIFKFQAPYEKLSHPRVNTYLIGNARIQTINVSQIEKINVEEMCNDGGYYYYFGIRTANEVLYMYPPGNDAHLLEAAINSWLNMG